MQSLKDTQLSEISRFYKETNQISESKKQLFVYIIMCKFLKSNYTKNEFILLYSILIFIYMIFYCCFLLQYIQLTYMRHSHIFLTLCSWILIPISVHILTIFFNFLYWQAFHCISALKHQIYHEMSASRALDVGF